MSHGYEASLVKRVVNELVDSIVNDEYPDHYLPPQVILSKKHGVSRTIMREALSVLISRRMVDVRPKRGTLINPTTQWLIVDHEVVEWRLRARVDPEFLHGLIEFRTMIDPRAAALAATRASRVQRAAIQSAFQDLVHVEARGGTHYAAVEALQKAIVDASGDELLAQLANVVRSGQRAIALEKPLAADLRDLAIERFGQVVQAIEAGDAPSARQAMTMLLTHTAARLASEFA